MITHNSRTMEQLCIMTRAKLGTIKRLSVYFVYHISSSIYLSIYLATTLCYYYMKALIKHTGMKLRSDCPMKPHRAINCMSEYIVGFFSLPSPFFCVFHFPYTHIHTHRTHSLYVVVVVVSSVCLACLKRL